MKTRHLRERSAAIGASLYARGLTFGSTGNISHAARRRRLSDDADQRLARRARSGEAVAARRGRPALFAATSRPRKPSCIWRCIAARRRAAPWCICIRVHSVAVSCLHEHRSGTTACRRSTAYYVMRIGRLPLVPYFRQATRRCRARWQSSRAAHHAVLLANHGPVVAGTSLAKRSMPPRNSRKPRSCSCCCAIDRSAR